MGLLEEILGTLFAPEETKRSRRGRRKGQIGDQAGDRQTVQEKKEEVFPIQQIGRYVPAGPILTMAEAHFCNALLRAVPEGVGVCPKVRIGDVIKPNPTPPSRRRTAREAADLVPSAPPPN